MATASIRPAAVAGQFYPDDPRVLRTQIHMMLSAVAPGVVSPKAVIVPHAGYMYSGAVAASAYAAIANRRDEIRRVVLLGPNHRVPVRGFALPAAQAFATPLGTVPLDRASWSALQARADVVVDDHPHMFEHSLEVQLPFLQTVLDAFELLPLLVGDAAPEAVADLLESLWGGPETLIVVSSDLSHYHTYRQAQLCDTATVEHILSLRDDLDHRQACGATPVNGLLRVARHLGCVAQLLDQCNSGDTSGERSRVVGYASIAFVAGQTHGHH